MVAEQPKHSAGFVGIDGGGMSVLSRRGHCVTDCVQSGDVMLPLCDLFELGLAMGHPFGCSSRGRRPIVETSRYDTNL